MKTTFALTVCTLCVNINAVFAGTIKDNKETKASIEFQENEGPTKPVDPENPEEPDPELPEVTGSLVIVHASSFDFGQVKVAASRELYPVKTVQPNVQIADLRGKGSGWYLDAALSNFTEAEDGAVDSLPGAIIYIRDGRLNSSTPPEYAPTITKPVKLTADGTPARVLTAVDGEGTGLWVDRFYPDYSLNPDAAAFVELEVLAGTASTGEHSATITWTLSNTP